MNDSLRQNIVGIDTQVPTLDGGFKQYIFLDNAASTPTFQQVLSCINDFMPWYSGVHRGVGLKSKIATDIFDLSRKIIADFVGADLEENVVVFGKNTTEVINKLSNRLGINENDIVITTSMEHHSNDLPWRQHKNLIHIETDEDGFLKIDHLKKTLEEYKGKIKLVAISGASNITGIINPIHDIARWCHNVGGKIFVDAAQLAPHRKINILPNDDSEHIDFIAFSAHKLYAPFGTGILIAPKTIFENGAPDIVGGGTVKSVSLDEVHWANVPEKEEAGSPNVVGAIACAKAISILENFGMENIAKHELDLLEYAYKKIQNIPKITLYGPTSNLRNKVGVITFNVDGMFHSHVAAILSYEGGIGVRNGCFCAQPYVKNLLNISKEEEKILTDEIISGNKSKIPGMVRASFGCYNNYEDIDIFVEMLTKIVRKEFNGEYIQEKETGNFILSSEQKNFETQNFFTHFEN